MREEIAKVIHPVLSYGLELRERVLRGEKPNLDREQQTLTRLLKPKGRFVEGAASGQSSQLVVVGHRV